MSTITTKDGTEIYYKDWGAGPAVTFSHGWPLNADAWDSQMLFLVQNGFRVVAHDRRGHGRSTQASSSNDMNGYQPVEAALDRLDRQVQEGALTREDARDVDAEWNCREKHQRKRGANLQPTIKCHVRLPAGRIRSARAAAM